MRVLDEGRSSWGHKVEHSRLLAGKHPRSPVEMVSKRMREKKEIRRDEEGRTYPYARLPLRGKQRATSLEDDSLAPKPYTGIMFGWV